MTDFEWNDSYIVGVKGIDKHNQYLLESMIVIYSELSQMKETKNHNLEFLNLSRYIDFHFACEEVWMNHSRYEFVSDHSEQHREITRTFVDIYNRFQEDKISVVTILSFLIETIITHIQTSDVGYGHFVNGKLSAANAIGPAANRQTQTWPRKKPLT